MATTRPSDTTPDIAYFPFTFNVGWDDLAKLPSTPITKRFITMVNNVTLAWRAVISVGALHTKLGFHIIYDGEPQFVSDKFVSFKVDMIVSNGRYTVTQVNGRYNPRPGVGEGWVNFGYRILSAFQVVLPGLDCSAPVQFRVTMEIPLPWNCPLLVDNAGQTRTDWFTKMRRWFDAIEDPAKAVFSNAKLIANDGKEFYCDKAILGMHSDVFAAMFRHPPAEGENENEYKFPAMSGESLKALLEYVYTGRVERLNQLSTSAMIELGDAAEQYGFKGLLRDCGLCLWSRAGKEPADAAMIASFSDLHEDYAAIARLKHRSFDVLSQNYEQLEATIDEKFKASAGDVRGHRLFHEFHLFKHRRVHPYFRPRS